MSEIKLLPCPFCGGETKVNLFLGNYCVTCNECMGAIFPAKGMTQEEAIKQWNNRQPMERIVDKVADMKDDCLQEYNKYLDGEDLRRGILLGEVIGVVKEVGGIE